MPLTQLVEQYTTDIDSGIEVLLREQTPYVADIAGYFFGWLDENFQPTSGVKKGKRVRPIMSLLTCEAVSGNYHPAIPLAMAIELIHNYSLIHDDIADRDDDRRGRPTVWKIWGDGIAINTGSVLYTLAYEAITQLDLPPQKIIDIHKHIIQTSIRLSEGQHWDISYERRTDVTQDMYLHMIDGKTAALLECATRLGAMVGTDDQKIIDAYASFGRHLGLAFQIRDDYLNIWIETEESGKTRYSDLVNKKKSFPVTYALGTLKGSELEKFAKIYEDVDSPMSEDEIQYVLGVLESIDAKTHTANLENQHTTEALRCLDETGIDNEAHQRLRMIADILIGRTS